ncbi:MAG: 50S ribosomal protein L9 [Alphaproteobacteria bacterium]|nr:50S ribosomal protein L9 [Alphaproteobacteria bacterium]
MQVVLLERIAKLGQMGDVVKVKDGYARNFLLPQQKALRATKDNMAYFEEQRAQLEARNLEARKEATSVAEKMEGFKVVMVRQASESDQLYGSVTPRDISIALTENGFSIDRQQVQLDHPLKTLGIHPIVISLHPEVEATIKVTIARSDIDAEERIEEDEAALLAQAEEVFESEELAEQAVEELTDKVEDEAEEIAEDVAEAEAEDTDEEQDDETKS